MDKINKNKVIHDWAELTCESVKVPVYTYLDETIDKINAMYGLRFNAAYFGTNDFSMLRISHTNPDFVVMATRHLGKIPEELLKDKVGKDFLKYLMFGKTIKFTNQSGVNTRYISVKDLIDKNY